MLLHSEVEMKSHPHPERPDRLRAITASLATAGIFPGRCFPISAREITEEELHMVHSLEHIQSVELTSQLLASYFTPDTFANEHSARAARLAAGLCADLASEILSGHAKNGFALVRPPGHHAGIRQAMGFCLHNNAAVAALAAQGVGAKRVLIVDWDVHHGNGTQEIFDGSKTVLYISLHRHEGGKFYPGTGAAHEVGSMGAEGYCVNVPWSRGGVGDNDYLFAFQHVVLPIASAFSPDFIIISAGFDAARGDPLGCCDVTPSGFAQMTHALNALSGGKLLVILEGGYNLRSISSSATAVIKVLLGESPGCEAENVVPSKSGLLTVMEVLKIQMKFWPTLEPVLLKLNLQWGTYALPNRTGNANKRPRREPAYVRIAEINRVLGYTGEPGTRTAGRGRDASVLLGYDPAYRGFTDRRLAHPSISAASTSTIPQQRSTRLNPGVIIAGQASEVPISEGVPLPRVVLRRSSRRQAVPQQQPEQLAQIPDTNQSSSSGYSRSPRDSGNMSRQSLNLSTLLTIPSRGRGASGRVSSTGHVPPPPRRNRRGSTRSSSSPRARGNSLEASDAHRDKRPRNQEAGASDAQATVATLETPLPNTQASHEAWTPRLVRGDRPVNVGDSASSSETALALAQGLLLPVDMQKESTSPSDRLVSIGLVSGIKFIQKMVTLGQRYQEAEAERIRLLNNNTSLLRSVTRLEGERDKAKTDAADAKGKLETAEDSLNQALAEIDGTKKAAFEDGYQKGFDAATAEYVEQMPGIQDQIWIASWEACLTKTGVAEDSPFWEDNDLPSKHAINFEELEEPLVDNVDQEIDNFTDADENIQMEAEHTHVVSPDMNPEQPSTEETTTKPINVEGQATEAGINTNVPNVGSSEVQTLD